MHIVTLYLNDRKAQVRTYKKESAAMNKKQEWENLYKLMSDEIQVKIRKQ